MIVLELPDVFNQPLRRGWLPPTLKTLKFGKMFNQPINERELFPKSMIKLIFGKHFDQPLDCLPDTLNMLSLGKRYFRFLYTLPVGLKKLILHGPFNTRTAKLPINLQKLYLYSNNITLDEVALFPTSLRKVKWQAALFDKYAFVVQANPNAVSVVDQTPGKTKRQSMVVTFTYDVTKSPEEKYSLHHFDQYVKQTVPHLTPIKPFYYATIEKKTHENNAV